MKILFFTDSLRGGGKERRMGELIKGLLQRGGYEVEIANMDTAVEYPIFKELNIPIHFLIRKSQWDPTIFLKIWRLCLKIKPHVLHVWDPMTAFYAIPVKIFCGVKLVNSMITIAPSNPNYFSLKFAYCFASMAFSDIILSNSKAGLRSFKAPEKKSRVIFNGFDFNRKLAIRDKAKLKSDLGTGSNKIVGMVASFTDHKDYATFFKAAKEIIRLRNDVIFIALGDGPFYEKFNKSLDQKDREKIKLLGRVKDVESYVNIFDIGVLLTNNEVVGEGISNSIMEYMAFGKPVIATDSGGTKEIVQNEVNGFLIGNAEDKMLVKYIVRLLNDQNESNKMGELNEALIREVFELENMVEKFIATYNQVLEVAQSNKKTSYLMVAEELGSPFDEGGKKFARSLLESLVANKEKSVRGITTRGDDIPLLNLKSYKINKLFLSKVLRQEIKNTNPDVIIYIPSSSLTLAALVRAAVLKMFSNKSTIGVIGLQPRSINLPKRIMMHLMLRSVLFFVQGENTKINLSKAGGRSGLIPSGIDLNIFKPVSGEMKMELRAKYKIEKSAFVLLHVGHINQGRNIDALLTLQQHIGNQVIIVGSSNTEQDKEILNRLRGENVIFFIEYIKEIEEIYQLSDCYVFPVICDQSAIEFPLSILEALACNLPVITTPYGGLPAYLGKNDSIHFIEDISLLPQKVEIIKKNKKVVNSRKLVEKFSWGNIGNMLIDQIENGIRH